MGEALGACVIVRPDRAFGERGMLGLDYAKKTTCVTPFWKGFKPRAAPAPTEVREVRVVDHRRALFRTAGGVLITVLAFAVLARAVSVLHDRNFLACIILTFTGLPLLRAGAELLRS